MAHKFYGFGGLFQKLRANQSLRLQYKNPIKAHSTFYQQLPPKSKAKFEKKVNYFILTKEFIPRSMPKVTDKMVALIAATAVQLTFGLPSVSLMHFNKILVYPNNYYSTINRQYHKGEVNPRLKAIVLSWPHFVEGLVNPNDGRNLGLHEMAHALKLENFIRNEEFGFFSRKEFNKWQHLAQAEMGKIKNGEESLFRLYASVNEDEFFAVSIEVYFEQPHQLYAYNSELYKTLSNLLRQDTRQMYNKNFSST